VNKNEEEITYIGSIFAINKFQIITDKNQVDITYQNDGKEYNGVMISKPVTKEKKEHLDKMIKEAKPAELIHTWYILCVMVTNSNKVLRIYYSPEIEYASIFKIDSEFPYDECIKLPIFGDSKFFQELELYTLLKKYNYEYETIKKTAGFSVEKLKIMSENVPLIKVVIELGLTISDFADIDAAHMQMVFETPGVIECALKFVNIFEIFGLNRTSQLLTKYGERKMPVEVESDEDDDLNNDGKRLMNTCRMQ
jgi:hypothetical protein